MPTSPGMVYKCFFTPPNTTTQEENLTDTTTLNSNIIQHAEPDTGLKHFSFVHLL